MSHIISMQASFKLLTIIYEPSDIATLLPVSTLMLEQATSNSICICSSVSLLNLIYNAPFKIRLLTDRVAFKQLYNCSCLCVKLREVCLLEVEFCEIPKDTCTHITV
jgi:hypothetical protein